MRSLAHPRRSCPHELSALTAELLDRSVAVQLALSGAIEAVIGRDAGPAAAAIAPYVTLPPLIVTDQPLAVDVRMVRAALRIAAACERVGDHAVSIARSAQRLLARPPAAAAAKLRELCPHARDRLARAMDAYVRVDLEQAQEGGREKGGRHPSRHMLLRTFRTVMQATGLMPEEPQHP